MITRHKILIFLASSGLFFLTAAGFFFDWAWITADWYFRFYAIGILLWSVRMKMQAINLIDSLILNIAAWLCVFNVFDELVSRTPAKPYKPYITTIVVVISSIYLYIRKCKNYPKNGEKR